MTVSISKSFSATGYSEIIQVPVGTPMKLDISGTFSATVKLEWTDNIVDGTWVVLYTETSPVTEEFTATGYSDQGGIFYRLHCTARASGTAVCDLTSISAVQVDLDVTGQVNIDGKIHGVVTVFVADGDGNARLGECAIADLPAGSGYAKGCILTATDGTTMYDTTYTNIGDATTANFVTVTPDPGP